MIKLILNHDHLSGVLGEAFSLCRHRLFIVTADVKDVYVPFDVAEAPDGRPRPRRGGRSGARSVMQVFGELTRRGVEVRLLHAGVPSGPFLDELRQGIPAGLTLRRCCRVHAKAVIADGKWMYLGSANLTGAGLGAKSARRRNFEAGIWTDEVAMIDSVLDMLDGIWNARECKDCGRKEYCPEPLEEPDL
jgi:hypothetical protein